MTAEVHRWSAEELKAVGHVLAALDEGQTMVDGEMWTLDYALFNLERIRDEKHPRERS